MKETVKLDHPIEANGTRVSEIHLRRVRVGDIEAAEKVGGGKNAQDIFLVSSLAELPPDAVRQLDFADWKKVFEKVQGFLS